MQKRKTAAGTASTKAQPRKEWSQMTRQEKRNTKLVIPGRGQMKAIDYIRSLAKTLPLSRNKGTGQTINHEEQLRIAFMEKGVDGINEYVKMYSELIEEKITDLAKQNAEAMAAEKQEPVETPAVSE